MASINNFSLVGVGSSIKLGKGGIVLAQAGGKLTVDAVSIATETFVTSQSYLTDATAATAGYLKIANINALNYIDQTELTTALADYVLTDELTTTLADYVSKSAIELYGIDLASSLNDDIVALGYVTAEDLDLTSYMKLDGSQAMTGNLNAGGFKVIGLAAGTTAGNAVEYVQFTDAVDGKEPTITAGTAGQYWDGTKTFVTLNKAAVGLGNVDNTSDANKPVSTATQTALDSKLTAPNDGENREFLMGQGTGNDPIWSYVDAIRHPGTGDFYIDLLAVNDVVGDTQIHANGHRIVNVANPIDDQDAANKQYVDGVAAGLSFKQSAIAATTANIANLATGAPSVLDSVNLATNDRVLVKDQTDAKLNGIYVVTTLGTGSNGVWTRSLDADENGEIKGGTFVFVTSGTANADKGFVVTAPDGSVTIGTDNIVWTQYSSTGTISLTAGTGISVGTSPSYTVALTATTVNAAAYGAADKAVTFTVDAQGRLTAAAVVDIAITQSQVTGLDTALTTLQTNINGKQDLNAGLTAISAIDGGEAATGLLKYNSAIGDWVIDSTVYLTAADISSKANQTEVDAIESAVGLSAAGAYVPTTGANYTNPATTVVGAIAILDTALASTDAAVSNKADQSDVDDALALKAPLASPTFTGTVIVPALVGTEGDNVATNKKYVDTEIADAVAAVAIPGATITAKAPFVFGSSSVTLVPAMVANASVTRLVVKITTAFGGTPVFTVSQNSVDYVVTADVDLATVGTYIVDFYDETTGAGDMTITLSGATGSGAGKVYVEYVNPVA